MMKDRLQEIRERALAMLQDADTLDRLNEARVAFLGKRVN